MPLTALPEEVLEIILLKVNAEDVLNVLSVVGGRGREGFWRKICLRNGFKNIPGEEESWRNIFCANLSWLQGIFRKSEYDVNDMSVGDTESKSESVCEPDSKKINHLSCSSNLPGISEHNVFLKKNKLLSQKGDEVLLRDVENPQKLQHKLRGDYLHRCDQSRTKLLLRTLFSVNVYWCEKDSFREVLVWNYNAFQPTSYILTDDYFVALKTDLRKAIVVYLNEVEEFSLPIPCIKVVYRIVSLSSGILNLLVLDGNNYALKRYNIENRKWLEDVQLFGCSAMIGIPKVKMNSRVVVSWSSLLEGRGVTPMKIWTSKEDDSSSSSFTPLTPDYVLNPQDVLWLLLEEDFVIFSETKKSSIFIFNGKERAGTREMVLSEHDYLGQSVIFGFLVLSYNHCFKLYDFKKATYLYEVLFDSGFSCKDFFVNEYFYVVFNAPYDNGGHEKLCIYDFRGNALGRERLDD